MAYEKELQDFTAQGTDLPESKLSEGFKAGEKPPANWFNSLFYRISQAVKELQTKSAEKTYVDSTIDQKLEEFGENVSIPIDTSLSTTSENPVQNKAITTELNKKVGKYNYTATIPTTGWSTSAPYTVSVTVTGILATDTPDISVNQSSTSATAQAQLEAWNCVNKIETGANKITCTCYESIPTTAIPVLIKGVR